jgi:hypothetical protein
MKLDTHREPSESKPRCMNKRLLAFLVIFLGVWQCFGATQVMFKSQDWGGGVQTRPIKLTPQYQYTTDGTNIYYGVPVTIQWTNGNGIVTNALNPNNYTVTASGINGNFVLGVPFTNVVVDAITLTSNLMVFTNWANSSGASLTQVSNIVNALAILNSFGHGTNVNLAGNTTNAGPIYLQVNGAGNNWKITDDGAGMGFQKDATNTFLIGSDGQLHGDGGGLYNVPGSTFNANQFGANASGTNIKSGVMLTNPIISGKLSVSNDVAGRIDIGLASLDILGPVGGTNVHAGNDGIISLQPITYNNVLVQPGQFATFDANKRIVGTNDGTGLTGLILQTNGTGYSNTLYSANLPTLPLIYFVTFDNAIDGQVHAYASPDGEHVLPAGADPLVTVNTTAAHLAVRDPRIYNRSNVWYMFTGYQYTGDNHFRVFSTTNFPYGWTSNQVITAYTSGTTWDPTPFYDPADGQLHLIFSQSANGVTGFQQYEIHLTNQNDMKSWSSATKLSGTIWTNSIGPCPVYWNGTYYLFAKQEDQVTVSNRYTYLASAPALLGPYTIIRSNNWMGMGYGYEGFSIIPYGNNMRGYIDDNGAATGAVFTECPMSTFPTGTWSSAVTIKGTSYGFANPGAVILTNAVDQINVMRAATFGNNQSKSPFDLWHYPNFDYCVAANLTPAAGNSTTRAAWNTMSLVVTNNYGMEIFMDYAGANTPTWYFITYAKGTGSYSINPANITSAGFNGTFNGIVAGSTVSASGAMTASTTLAVTKGITATSGISSASKNLLAPTAITVGASPFILTNNATSGLPGTNNIFVFIDGAGVTGTVGVNGTTIYSALSGANATIPLQPNETVTVTYTIGTPVMKWKPF